jgi:hypothetical protein
MMTKIDEYRYTLNNLADWDDFLLTNSGLPGPRANLELARAVADLGDEARFQRYVTLDPQQAPTNSPQEFLVFCGVVGLGRLVAEARDDLLPQLRSLAPDPRWRTREALAIGLQSVGAADMDALLQIASSWCQGTYWEQRAAIAAVCEPALLQHERHARRVLQLLHDVTSRLAGATDRRDVGFKTLRKTLGYAWSVAVVALPEIGEPLFERWLESDAPDVRWLMRQNLRKKRLQKMDPSWVSAAQHRIDGGH